MCGRILALPSEPNVRSNIGAAIAGKRERWIIQGHFGSTWQEGQYVRTRDMEKVKPAFEDLLSRLGTDYLDLGMIHFVDEEAEFHRIMDGAFFAYVKEQRAKGVIRHIGLSTHNPKVGVLAAQSGEIEMLLFSINPAFDLLPASEDINTYFAPDYEEHQCIHYALTRPAVASVLAGYDTPEHVLAAVAYEDASEEEKDYASTLAGAPRHAYSGQCTYCGHCAPCPKGIDIAMLNKLYDLAAMQDRTPDSIRAHYRALPAKAEDCIACGSCEKRCPFGVPVIQRMEQIKQLHLV